MREGISGTGELWHDGAYLCTVHYEIEAGTGEAASSFTLTDGLLAVAEAEARDPAVLAQLEPYETLELRLTEPLADGRARLPIRIEPYEGHRPDERYQIRVQE